MATNQGKIRFGVEFQSNTSGLKQAESSLNALKVSLRELQALSSMDLIHTENAEADLKKLITTADQVEKALQESFNVKLNTYNISEFNNALSKTGLDLKTVQKQFNQAGEKGTLAFRQLTSAITSTRLELKESHQLLNAMATTFANTIKWSVASTALNTFTGSIQKAYGFVKNLDSSLNDIMIVTDKSSEEMEKFAYRANRAAKALGTATTEYTKASLIYYQQGLSDSQVEARTKTTIKASNITGQSAEAVSEQLTAVWNGYKVQAAETELYIDKLSAVAARTAADLEELSTGMSKVASAANIMGVDVDQLNAQLATIVSVTREAPESIGTALKTVYARMSDIQAGLDEETTLDEYTQQMAQMGVHVLDAKGQLRDMGEVVEEIGDNWDNLSRSQQVSLAQTIAGTRQYSRMMALFDNWEMYQEAKTTSQASQGTLQEQQDKYLESLEAHTERLATAGERLYASFFDADSFKTLLDLLSLLVEGLGNFVEGIGGGGVALLSLGSIGMKVFQNQISRSLATTISNLQHAKDNSLKLEEVLKNIDNIDFDNLDEATRSIVEMRKAIYQAQKSGLIDDEQMNHLMDQVDEYEKKINNASKAKISLTDDDFDAKGKEKYSKKNTSLTDIAKEAESNFDKGIKAEDLLEQSQSFQVYKQQVEDAKKGAKNDLQSAKNALDNLQEGVEEQSLEGLTDRLYDLQDSSSLIDKEIEEKIKNKIKELEQVTKEFEKTQEKLTAAQEKLEFAQEDVATAPQSQKAQAEAREGAAKSVEAKARADVNTAKSHYERTLKETEQLIKDIDKELEKNADNTIKHAEKVAQGSTQAVEKEAKEFAKEIQDAFNKIDLTKTINNIVNVVSSLGQVASSIMMIQNLGSIWSNDDLTTGEKILQTVMNLGTALPMLITGLTSLKTAWSQIPSLGNVINAMYVKFIKNSAAASFAASIEEQALKASTDAKTKNAFWTKLLEEAKENLTEEQYKQAAASLASAQGLDAETEALIKNAAAQQYADNVQTSGGGGAKNFLSGIGGKLKDGGKAVGKVLPVALFAVAAIAAVKGAYTYISEWYKQEEIAAQKAKEAASQANEQTESLRQTYEDLKSTINSYSEQKTALDELTKGTQDYRDALHGANEEVLKLLRLYPGLVDYIEESSEHEGLLEVTEEGLKKAQEVLAAQLAAAKAIEYGLNATALQKQQEQKVAEQARNIKTGGQTAAEWGTGAATGVAFGVAGGVAGGVLGGMAMGATLGAAAGPVGAIVGAVIGLAAAAVTTVATTSESIQDQNERLTKKAAELYLEDATLFKGDAEEVKAKLAEGLDLNDEALINNLYNNRQAIVELSAEIKANTEAIAVQRKQGMSEYLKSLQNVRYDNTKFQDQIDERLSKFVTDEKIKEYEDQAEDEWDEDIHKTVAEAYKWDYVENGDGVGKFAKTDAEGNVQNFELGDESLRAMWAQIKAFEDAGVNVTDAVNAVEKVADTGYENVDKQLANVATGKDVDLDSLTENELKLFKKSLNNIGLLTQKELRALGYTSTEEITQFALGAQEIFQEKLDKLANAIPEGKYRDKYNALLESGVLANSDLSYQSKENLSQIYASQNEVLVNGLESLISSLGDNADDFLNLLPGLESYEDLQKFQNALYENAELSYLLTDDIFKNFVAGLETTFDLTEEWNQQKEQERIGALQSIGNSLKSFGDTISADQFKQLTPELKTYFVQMADGTYALKGAADSFGESLQQVLLTEQKRKLTEKREKLKELQDKQSTLAAGWETEGKIRQNMPKLSQLLGRDANQVEKEAQSAYDKAYDSAGSWGDPRDAATKDSYGSHAKTQTLDAAMKEAKEVWDELKNLKMPDGKTVQEYLKPHTDIDYWEEVLNKGDYDAGVYQGVVIAQTQFQNAWNQFLQENTPEMTEGAYDTEVKTATTEYNQQQRLVAGLAGSLEKFEQLIQEGDITDEDVIRDYTDYYTNLAESEKPQIIQEKIDKIDTELKLKLSTEEAIRSLRDFQKELDEEMGKKSYEFDYSLDFYSFNSDFEHIKTTLEQIDAELIGTQEYFTQKQEKITQLQETALNMQQAINDAEQSYLDWLDDINNAWGEQIEYLNIISATVEHQLEMSELLYGEDAEKALEYQKEMVQVEQDKYEARLKQYEEISAMYQDVIARPEKYTKEQADAIKEQYFSIGQEVLSQASALAQAALEQFELDVEVTVKTTILGDDWKTWEFNRERQDWTSEMGDKYFDDINRSFQEGSAERLFDKALRENQGNIKAQERLNDLKQRELAVLREKDKLTAKDIERVNKKLELEQALIALEEARNNTSQMRLVRGADGTYGYQYVADMDAIAEAEERVAQAENDLYNFDKERYQESLGEIYDMTQDFMEDVQRLSADGLTEEEKEFLTERYEAIQQAVKDSGSSLVDLETTMGEVFGKTLTEGDKAAMGISASYEKMLKDLPIGDINQLFADIEAKRAEYTSNIKDTSDITKDLGENAKNAADAIGGVDGLLYREDGLLSENTKNKMDTLNGKISKMKGAFDTVKTSVEELTTAYINYLKYVNTGDVSNISGITETPQVIKNAIAPMMSTYSESGQTKYKVENKNQFNSFVKGQMESIGREEFNKKYGGYGLSYDQLYSGLTGEDSGDVRGNKDDVVLAAERSAFVTMNQDPLWYWLSGAIDFSAKTKDNTFPIFDSKKLQRIVDEMLRRLGLVAEDGLSYTAKFENLPNDKDNPIKDHIKWLRNVANRQNNQITWGNLNTIRLIYEAAFPGTSVKPLDENLSSFDTGGYTGAWGVDGKLAILHEKELILNQEDTANILSAVSIMREISEMLDVSLHSGLNNLLQNVTSHVNLGDNDNSIVVEQDITIQAEFPNATDKNEIKAAFDELALLAAQRINSNKRK